MRLVLLLSVILAACSDSTGPGGSMDGLWLYNARVTTATITCNLIGMTVRLEGGDSFTGTTIGGAINCFTGGGIQTTLPIEPAVIQQGTRDGSDIRFTLGGLHTGTLRGDSVAGEAAVPLSNGTANGTFTLVRK